MEPFVASFVRREQVEHAHTFVQGLLSDLDHKNAESIAYRFGQEQMPLQWFVGVSGWNDDPLRDQLVEQVGRQLGEDDGVIVFDPSAFVKSGRESVGVARQWCGRLGKVENCQVAVFMGYVSGQEHALVDTRLFLPREWTQDKARCEKAGIPKDRRRHRTRHQLCLEMLAKHGEKLPHRWIAGDDELGRPYAFRRRLDRIKGTLPAGRALQHVDPRSRCTRARIRRSRAPAKRPWQRVDTWMAARDQQEWTKIDVRDGAKGPLVVEAIKRPVVGRTHRRQEGHPETLVIVRYRDRDDRKVLQTDYYLSNAPSETTLEQFTRVAKAEHRIEECIRRSKSEAGLADYEVRNWKGWHHHQTLSLIATWFLVTEARRGKKLDASDHRPSNPPRHLIDPTPRLRMRYQLPHRTRARTTPHTKRARSPIPLEAT